MNWTTALAGCAECVEESMSLPRGTVLTPLEDILFGDKATGGNATGFCNTEFSATDGGDSGLEELIHSGAKLTKGHNLPVLFFNVTMMA